jgi:ubiquinone/menaquinone biosynthesis C-methylase UbiE
MASQAPFIPKQAPARIPELNAMVMGRTSEDIASHILKDILPPLDAKSVIHDNGAGPGPVTQTIFELYPTNDFTIYATDNNPHMLAGLDAAIQANKWEAAVKTSIVDAQEIEFEDNKFDYSFS